MRKHYFWATAMALMLSGSMQAQSLFRQASSAKGAPVHSTFVQPVSPGVQTPVSSRQATTRVRSSVKRPAYRLAPVLNEALAVPTEEKDTIFLTKYSEYKGDELGRNIEYTYNDYGLRLSERETSGVNDGITGDGREKRYKYVIGENNFWISLLTEVKAGEQWVFNQKIERVINDENQVLEERLYKWDEYGQKEYLSESYKYDYAHEFNIEELDEATQTAPKHKVRGICTDWVYYNPDGTVYAENRFQWYEPAQTYIHTLQFALGGETRLEAELLENEVVTRNYRLYYDTEELETEHHDYYGDREGYLDISNYYGEIDAEGQYDLIEKNQPSAGYTTRTHYEYYADESTWIKMSRVRLKGLASEEDTPVPGVNYECVKEGWNFYDNEWYPDYKREGTWLSGSLLCDKTSKADGEDETYYYLYNGQPNGPWHVWYSPELQQYQTIFSDYAEVDGVTVLATVYSYYNLQNELVRQVKFEDSSDVNRDEHKYIPLIIRISEMKNGEWAFLETHESIDPRGIGDGDGNVRIVRRFGKDGKILSYKEYAEFNGEECVIVDLNYEYLPNGYRSTYADYEIDKDGVRSVVSSKMREYLQLPNGDYQKTEISHLRGELVYNNRTVVTPDMICTYYWYDEANDTYIESSRSCFSLVTVDEEKGLETVLNREIEDGQVVNHDKTITNTNESVYDEYYEKYEWDAVKGKWRGVSRSFSSELDFQFAHTPFKDPFAYDKYFNNPCAPGRGDEEEEDVAMHVRNQASYRWDEEKFGWVPEVVELYELVSSTDTETVMKKTEQYGTSSEITTYTVTKDAEGYLTAVETKSEASEGNRQETLEQLLTEYTRNDYGYVTEKVQTDKLNVGSEVKREVYEYTPTRIYETAIENVKGEELFQISGREITAPDKALVAVYDLSGRQVAVGHGQLTLPAAGIYVVTCNGSSVKVSCR